MAIKLAERAVAAVAALYTSAMPAVIAIIDTDRGDFSLPQATNPDVYTYRLRERGTHASSVLVEVFDEGGIAFDNPYNDAANNRAVYALTVNAMVTVFNNASWTEAQMNLIRHRYGSALKTLIGQNFELADNDDATQIATVQGIETTTAGEQGIEVVTATAEIEVKCEECVA